MKLKSDNRLKFVFVYGSRIATVCALLVMVPRLCAQGEGNGTSVKVESGASATDADAALQRMRDKIMEQVNVCVERIQPALSQEQLPVFVEVASKHFVGEMRLRIQLNKAREKFKGDKAKIGKANASVNEKRSKLRIATEKEAKTLLSKPQMKSFRKVLDELTPRPPPPRVSGGGGGGGFGGDGGDGGDGGGGGGGGYSE